MITATGLRKQFGTQVAVEDVSFQAKNGSITGLIGPNGSGKTTTVRMLTGLFHPDAGTTQVDSINPILDPAGARRRLGVLTDSLGNYPRMTPREHLAYFGQLHRMKDAEIDGRTNELFAMFDLGKFADRPASGFSQGERMKLALARSLVHDPPNLILDEPANGLDVNAVRALRTLLLTLRDAGKCIILSSHILQEIAAVCDRVVVLARGRVVAESTPLELLGRTGTQSLEEAFVRVTSSDEAQKP